MSRPQKKKTGNPSAGSHSARKKPASSKRGPTSRRPGRKRPAAGRINFSQEGERLQKVLAAAGVCSRREAELLIAEGRVAVDGKIVTEVGTRVDRNSQEIRVDGEALARPKLAYFVVNKPEGVVCTSNDPAGRLLVTDLLPPDTGRVYNVGRLDITSEGLILVTNDGELANQLTHPKHGVEKTYEVQVSGHLDVETLSKLRKGVHLAEGFVQVVNVHIKLRRRNGTILEMVLDEGRNREIRRLFAKLGHRVQRLTRVAIGPIRLGEMPKGASRRLTPEEVSKLKNYVHAAENKPRRESDNRRKPANDQGTFEWQQRKKRAAAGKSARGGKPDRTTRSSGPTKTKRGNR